jgi:site-specific DNA recombinase
MSMQALRVALYARVSSNQQTDQGTIASQVAALEARILQDGLFLEPDYRFIDEGHSGATLIRPPGVRPFARSAGSPLCLPGFTD